jgi:hypothetical protein
MDLDRDRGRGGFSVVGQFLTADRGDREAVVQVGLGQEWAAVRVDRQECGARCIRRDQRRVVQEDRDSVQEWVRGRDLGKGRLVRVQEWAVLRGWLRHQGKHRVRRVRDREAAEDRGTRRPKKDR